MGYERWRLQRAKVPDDLICKRCDGVLRDPVHCQECKGYFCEDCLKDPPRVAEACEHPTAQRAEVNKYLRTKLSELVVCCRFKKQGCGVVAKISAVDAHEKTCSHQSHQTPPSSIPTPSDPLTPSPSDVDFRPVVCPRGCHKRLKANELPAHDCLQWLLTLTASQHDRNRRLKSEYEQARSEEDALKEELEHYRNSTDAEIREYQVKLRDVLNQKKAEETARAQVETGDSSYMRFREHTYQRLATFTSKADKELEEYFKQTTEVLRSHTGRSRQTLADYTTKTKLDAANFSVPANTKPKSPMKGVSPAKSPSSSLGFSVSSRAGI